MAKRVRKKRKRTCETPKKRVWGEWDDEDVPKNGKKALTEIEKLR